MSNIRKIIDSLPAKTPKARTIMRENINERLEKDPEDRQAIRLLGVLDDIETSKKQERSRKQDAECLKWNNHDHGKTKKFAYYRGKEIGRIFQISNHSNRIKFVYRVVILDNELPDLFHHVEEARKAGEQEFKSRRKDYSK